VLSPELAEVFPDFAAVKRSPSHVGSDLGENRQSTQIVAEKRGVGRLRVGLSGQEDDSGRQQCSARYRSIAVLRAGGHWEMIFAAMAERLPVTAKQAEELDRRLAAHDSNPGEGVTWEEIRDRLRKRG
jgi:putative addiction module component (TIGR02574 family)